jgi:chemotaxis signal transduction protein
MNLSDPGYVLFRISGNLYAIELLNVREIAEVPAITPLPGYADFLGGIINYKGVVIPAIHLDFLLSLRNPAEKTINDASCMIVADGPTGPAAFIFDSFEGLVSIPLTETQVNSVRFLKGIIDINGTTAKVIDIACIFKHEIFRQNKEEVTNV